MRRVFLIAVVSFLLLATCQLALAQEQKATETVSSNAFNTGMAFLAIAPIIIAAISAFVIAYQQRNQKAMVDSIADLLKNETVKNAAHEKWMQSALHYSDVGKWAEVILANLSKANIPLVDPIIDAASDIVNEKATTDEINSNASPTE